MQDTDDYVQPEMCSGVSLDEWARGFAPHIVEFAATQFVFSTEHGQVRIALGNSGPFTSARGDRAKPQYTHAVTLPASVAVDLAKMLLQHVAQPGETSGG